MPLERIRVDGLRILKDVDCRLHPERNYFFGPNGAGKTSLLEAIYLLGRGRSFRTRQSRRLVQHGRESLSVYAEHRGAAGDVQRIGVGVGPDGLEYRIDRRAGVGVTDVARRVRVDVIDPSLHKLVEGGPSERRRFIDWGVFHVEPSYLDAWKRYRRVLGQRNAALKAQAGTEQLATWNRALIDAGEVVHRAREEYVERLARAVTEVGGRLLGSRLEITYRPGWRLGLGFAEALAEAGERDRAFGHTQVGPHRADLVVSVDGVPAADEASRGQQKLVAAALIAAQIRETHRAAKADVVLLVDDPAAELDRHALGRLVTEIEALPCQLVITGLSPEGLPVEAGCPVFHVEQGRVERCYNESI
ncbi:MAG TPA: DNA replication/repair protein RecF [Gammaproteobacteria bacterium]